MGSSTGRQLWSDDDADWLGVECGHKYIARLRTMLGASLADVLSQCLCRANFAVETVGPHRGIRFFLFKPQRV